MRKVLPYINLLFSAFRKNIYDFHTTLERIHFLPPLFRFDTLKLINKKVTFGELNIFGGSAVKFTIGIKDDAKHKGGINLFGKNFGDFNQAIIMTIE